MDLYSRIRQRREELGMSQDELASKMGYKDRSTIAKIESGVNDITQSKIKAIANALDTTTAWLMGWDDSPQPRSNISNSVSYPAFNEKEIALVIAYRQANEDDRAIVDTALRKYTNQGDGVKLA